MQNHATNKSYIILCTKYRTQSAPLITISYFNYSFWMGCNYSRTTIFSRYNSGAQLMLQQIFAPLFNFQVLYTFLSAKNTGTYYSKSPANPHKIKVFSIANRRFPRVPPSGTYRTLGISAPHTPFLPVSSRLLPGLPGRN